ncbi:hypothetical protein T484DRAFT_1918140 [Baffinella frigidus]|nr:hypothetical protein T484DRAFT_1918140 [Cryptophyta sp. CCMP2293]
MRPLTEDETKIFFEKLSSYIGRNIKHLIDRPDEEYCFRLHKERVYYMSQSLCRRAAHAERSLLVHLGTCFGKFTKSMKFKLQVTCLDFLAQVVCHSAERSAGGDGDRWTLIYAKYKVWVKPSSELSFLYGNNVLKAGLGRITENTAQYQGVVVYWLGRITENTAQYQGVVVYSMADVPLGFGVTAKSTQECRLVYSMADVPLGFGVTAKSTQECRCEANDSGGPFQDSGVD